MSVVDNESACRFELEESGELAIATYRKHGDVYVIPHVEAALGLRGKGTAGRLMDGVVAMARANGFKIHPSCPYAKHWFETHPDQSDVVA